MLQKDYSNLIVFDIVQYRIAAVDGVWSISTVWQAMFALLGAAGGLAGCPNDSESAGRVSHLKLLAPTSILRLVHSSMH